jgi:hypothetical protein
METAERMMKRRNISFTEADKKIWKEIYSVEEKILAP